MAAVVNLLLLVLMLMFVILNKNTWYNTFEQPVDAHIERHVLACELDVGDGCVLVASKAHIAQI